MMRGALLLVDTLLYSSVANMVGLLRYTTSVKLDGLTILIYLVKFLCPSKYSIRYIIKFLVNIPNNFLSISNFVY